MKKISVTILFCITLTVNAQNYRISFEGTGESTTVNSVRVENLNSGATLTLNGNDILRLTQATDIYSVENTNSSGIKIYPNPMNENSLMEINVPVAGEAMPKIRTPTCSVLLCRLRAVVLTVKASPEFTAVTRPVKVACAA